MNPAIVQIEKERVTDLGTENQVVDLLWKSEGIDPTIGVAEGNESQDEDEADLMKVNGLRIEEEGVAVDQGILEEEVDPGIKIMRTEGEGRAEADLEEKMEITTVLVEIGLEIERKKRHMMMILS